MCELHKVTHVYNLIVVNTSGPFLRNLPTSAEWHLGCVASQDVVSGSIAVGTQFVAVVNRCQGTAGDCDCQMRNRGCV